MKSITKFIQESLINEAFQSTVLQQYLKPNKFKYRWDQYELQWSKVKDSDLHEIDDENEARRIQRKKKESNYIIWVGKDGYGDNSTESVQLVTWGPDIIDCAWRKERTMTARSAVDNISFVKAYEVDIQDNMFRSDIQKQRREMRDGATALKDNYRIASENKKRYEDALAKMHTGSRDEVTKLMGDAMTLYTNTLNNYIKKFTDAAEGDCPSSYDLMSNFRKMNQVMSSLIDGYWSYDHNVEGKGISGYAEQMAKSGYDKVKECADKIAEICTKLSQE